MDLRGRGHSETTSAGTFGWSNHAKDLVSLADHFGASTFDVVGHSMGAFIGLDLAASYPDRCRRLVVLDAVGPPEQNALGPIVQTIARLGKTYPSAQEYLGLMRGKNAAITWHAFWEAQYVWETVQLPEGGIGLGTSLMAVTEDATYGASQDVYALWSKLSCRTLLLRATQPIGKPNGFIVSAADAARFAKVVPQAVVIEVDANHYTIIINPAAIDSLVNFLID
jgi:pimeloyl-ACP methyl ester carboxylesterase